MEGNPASAGLAPRAFQSFGAFGPYQAVVSINANVRTRWGYAAANACATQPPIEHPATLVEDQPTESSSAARSSAKSSTL